MQKLYSVVFLVLIICLGTTQYCQGQAANKNTADSAITFNRKTMVLVTTNHTSPFKDNIINATSDSIWFKYYGAFNKDSIESISLKKKTGRLRRLNLIYAISCLNAVGLAIFYTNLQSGDGYPLLFVSGSFPVWGIVAPILINLPDPENFQQITLSNQQIKQLKNVP